MASYLQIKGYSKLLKNDLAWEVTKMLVCLKEDNEHRQNKAEQRESKGEGSVAVVSETSSLKLTREEFRKIFITPLERAFDFKTYFSGKESEGVGLGKISGNYYGWSFTTRKNAPIVISFRPNQQDTLRTLVHEYAHSILHRVGTEGRKLNKAEKELEAETVAKLVTEGLGLVYTNKWYLPHYETKYFKKTGKKYQVTSERKVLIEQTVKLLLNALKGTEKIATNLMGKEEADKKRKSAQARSVYKYEVCCPTCTNSWKYKSKGKTVKNAHKYYCNSCGTKTLGKFIVKEL